MVRGTVKGGDSGGEGRNMECKMERGMNRKGESHVISGRSVFLSDSPVPAHHSVS